MIWELLPQGEEDAISTRMLVYMIGFRSARDLQFQVAREREAGKLILSTSKGGYFIPQDGDQGRPKFPHLSRHYIVGLLIRCGY